MTAADTDQQLVARVQKGDTRAFDLLVLKYQHRIAGLVSRFIRDSHEVQDVTQETFIKGFQALKCFKGDSSFYTWVYRIAVNKTINFLKQRRNRTNLSLNDLDTNAENDPDLVALTSEKTPRRDVM